VVHLEDGQLKELLQTLCAKCTSGKKEEHRDIAVIGLKTAVAEVAPRQAEVLVDIVVPTLINGIASKASYTQICLEPKQELGKAPQARSWWTLLYPRSSTASPQRHVVYKPYLYNEAQTDHGRPCGRWRSHAHRRNPRQGKSYRECESYLDLEYKFIQNSEAEVLVDIVVRALINGIADKASAWLHACRWNS